MGQQRRGTSVGEEAHVGKVISVPKVGNVGQCESMLSNFRYNEIIGVIRDQLKLLSI